MDKHFFFRDLNNEENLDEDRSFHAAGIVYRVHCDLPKGSESGKDLAVIFFHPFIGGVQREWRSVDQVELFQISKYDHQSGLKILENIGS